MVRPGHRGGADPSRGELRRHHPHRVRHWDTRRAEKTPWKPAQWDKTDPAGKRVERITIRIDTREADGKEKEIKLGTQCFASRLGVHAHRSAIATPEASREDVARVLRATQADEPERPEWWSKGHEEIAWLQITKGQDAAIQAMTRVALEVGYGQIEEMTGSHDGTPIGRTHVTLEASRTEGVTVHPNDPPP